MKTTTNGKSPRARGREIRPGAPNEIRFYRATEKPYGAFSNLYRRSIVFEGREYASAEHAYQAGKARKQAVRDWLLNAPSPSLLAMAAHGLYAWDVVPDWATIKYDRMRKVLRAKFSQHEDLMLLLLSTGNARLVEVGRVNNSVNRTWGEVDGKGQNMLGVLLMELRAELRQNFDAANKVVMSEGHERSKPRDVRVDRFVVTNNGRLEAKRDVVCTLRHRTV